jgi:cell division protease FtsH
MDEAVKKILDDCYQPGRGDSGENREDMDKVVEYLLEKETITGGEMVAILEGRDPATAEDEYASTESRPQEIEAPARHIHMTSEKIEAPENGGETQAEPSEEPSDVQSDTAAPESPESQPEPETPPQSDDQTEQQP